MNSDSRFLDFMSACGGKSGTPSSTFRDWLRSHGLSEQAITIVCSYVLSQSNEVGAIDFYSEKGILGVNGEDGIPIAIRDGLLIVGGCLNGDSVAIDVRERLGVTGYIGHETMWQVSNVREKFIPVAASLNELATVLTAGDPPLDYYQARDRYESQTEPE
jgi:hypothetical protein